MSESIGLLHIDVRTLPKLGALSHISSVSIDATGTPGQVVQAIAAQQLSEPNFKFATCGLDYLGTVHLSLDLIDRTGHTPGAAQLLPRTTSSQSPRHAIESSLCVKGSPAHRVFRLQAHRLPYLLGDCRRFFWKQTSSRAT